MATAPIAFHLDSNGNPILALRIGTIVNAAVTSSSAESSLPTSAKIIEIASNVDCWLKIGAAGQAVSSSTGFFFPKGTAIYSVDEDQVAIQYIQDTVAGRISVVELY